MKKKEGKYAVIQAYLFRAPHSSLRTFFEPFFQNLRDAVVLV